MIRSILSIIANEGSLGLFKGLFPSMIKAGNYYVFKIKIFTVFRVEQRLFVSVLRNGMQHSEEVSTILTEQLG